MKLLLEPVAAALVVLVLAAQLFHEFVRRAAGRFVRRGSLDRL